MLLPIVITAFRWSHLLLFISGLPDSVLQKAAAKSIEFEGAYGKHRKKFEDDLSDQCLVDEMVVFVQKFMDTAANLSRHKSPESIGTSSLTELQHRAQILLQKSWTDWKYCIVRVGSPSVVNDVYRIYLGRCQVIANFVGAQLSYFKTTIWGKFLPVLDTTCDIESNDSSLTRFPSDLLVNWAHQHFCTEIMWERISKQA